MVDRKGKKESRGETSAGLKKRMAGRAQGMRRNVVSAGLEARREGRRDLDEGEGFVDIGEGRRRDGQ